MAPTLTEGTYLKLPEHTVHTEYDLQMLGVYHTNEISLQEAGFFKIVRVPVEIRELQQVVGYTYEVSNGEAFATPIVAYKDSVSVGSILRRELSKEVDAHAQAYTELSPIARAFRAEYAFNNLCRLSPSPEKLIHVYSKILKLLKKEPQNG